MSETPKLPGVVGARVMGVVPTSFEEIWRMGNMLSQTKMVPEAFQGKPNDCTAALMYGLELGLSPMAAMQSIAVINGKPSLYGDGMIAVVRSSGLLEWIKETDDGSTATCVLKRRGEPDAITRTFSQEDAKRAQLAGKVGPWTQYPQRMRAMRARSWALRDTFADVLRGIASAEEMEDVHEMKDVTPVSARPPAIMDELPDIPDGSEPVATVETSPETDQRYTDDHFIGSFETALCGARGPSDLDEIWEANAAEIGERGLEQRAGDMLEAYRKRHEAVEAKTPAAEPAPAPEADLQMPWETAETAPEKPAPIGDMAATAAVKGLEMRLGNVHNATLVKEVWRNFQNVFAQLGPDAQALATKAKDAALARVKKTLQAAE